MASSWKFECNTKLEDCEDVRKVKTHMCQFGMVSRIGGVGTETGPVLKPTGFLTNSECIAIELGRECARDHKHVALVGGRAAGAAIYPNGLCQAICRGLATQLHENKIGKVRTLPMDAPRLLSISMACQQSTGGYPAEIVNNKGELGLNGSRLRSTARTSPRGGSDEDQRTRRRHLGLPESRTPRVTGLVTGQTTRMTSTATGLMQRRRTGPERTS